VHEHVAKVRTWTRVFVYAFLAVFAVTGIAHLEPWPFTGFRLFSAVRSDTVNSWHIAWVDDAGQETPIDLGDMPVAYRSSNLLISSFADMNGRERDAICNAWVAPQRDSGVEVALVRIYVRTVSVRPDGSPSSQRLVYKCGEAP
jgi:hypothetical protein